MLEFPLMLVFRVPAFAFVVVPVLVVVVVPVLLLPVFEVDVLDVVVVVLVVVFALPVLALSVVQPVQKAATASKAKRAKVLRIEFFSCNPVGQFVKSCVRLIFSLPAFAATRPMFRAFRLSPSRPLEVRAKIEDQARLIIRQRRLPPATFQSTCKLKVY
jgi:hypothetical protein